MKKTFELHEMVYLCFGEDFDNRRIKRHYHQKLDEDRVILNTEPISTIHRKGNRTQFSREGLTIFTEHQGRKYTIKKVSFRQPI